MLDSIFAVTLAPTMQTICSCSCKGTDSALSHAGQDREAIARSLAVAQKEAANRRQEHVSLKEKNAGLAEQIALDSEQLGRLRQATYEDAKVKTTVQDIIYDIEREARQEISRLKAENAELRGRLQSAMQLTPAAIDFKTPSRNDGRAIKTPPGPPPPESSLRQV